MYLCPHNLSELGGLSKLSVAELTDIYCTCEAFHYYSPVTLVTVKLLVFLTVMFEQFVWSRKRHITSLTHCTRLIYKYSTHTNFTFCRLDSISDASRIGKNVPNGLSLEIMSPSTEFIHKLLLR